MVSYLCEAVGVSRSGYYNYFSDKSTQMRKEIENNDKILKDNILKAYKFKGRKKGARLIKMTLLGQFNVIYNLKRIRRIMKKYDIICPIRKAKPYRKIAKATLEHSISPNLLNRNFKQNIPRKVLLTDITYLFYGNSKRAYLSTIKDGSTNEILAYNISTSLDIDLDTTTVKKLMKSKVKLAKDAFIHSDQGVHYTSPIYQRLVKKYGIGQSMSRRGNCWGNAPQELFFGNFKDEAYIKQCTTLKELEYEVKQYMIYYNKFRYQWNFKNMNPVEYRNHLNNIAYGLFRSVLDKGTF